jgi:hypothetical protein
MRTRKIVGSIVVAMVALVLGAPLATAEEYTCRGTVGAITVDNLRVPDGASCALEGTKVKGTIKVESKASLLATGVQVIGNVQAENAKKVVVRGGSSVGGSVQIVQGGAARVVKTKVKGDILYDDNRRALAALRNTIGGNLQAFQNTGGLEISKNRIDGNLQCKENNPAPVGGGNVVGGNKEDQCKRL